MKADKVTVTIVIESLSVEVVRNMVSHAVESMNCGAECGRLEMSDGDSVEWSTSRENVTF